ncbi:hypothetical protein D3C71_1881670 [compost metagenome]
MGFPNILQEGQDLFVGWLGDRELHKWALAGAHQHPCLLPANRIPSELFEVAVNIPNHWPPWPRFDVIAEKRLTSVS